MINKKELEAKRLEVATLEAYAENDIRDAVLKCIENNSTITRIVKELPDIKLDDRDSFSFWYEGMEVVVYFLGIRNSKMEVFCDEIGINFELFRFPVITFVYVAACGKKKVKTFC